MGIIDLLPPRLSWNGRKGIAVGRSAVMTLSLPPYLGIEFAEIDYAPALDVRLIRRSSSSPMDDMNSAEADACSMFLEALD